MHVDCAFVYTTGSRAIGMKNFNRGSGRIHLRSVYCNGSETMLIGCRFDTNFYCTRDQEVGVRCLSCEYMVHCMHVSVHVQRVH